MKKGEAMDLTKIAEEMEAMTGGDKEAEHSRADDLLLETIKRLSPKRPDGGAVDRIVASYAALDKWYA